MTAWLYQMNANKFSVNQYRDEVWEGTPVTNWGIGEKKDRPKPGDIVPGDIIILFFTKSYTTEPGIYGWGIVTFFQKDYDGRDTIGYRPAPPSDYLKMNPIAEDDVSEVIQTIRGRMPEGTIFKVQDEELDKIRHLIAECYGLT